MIRNEIVSYSLKYFYFYKLKIFIKMFFLIN